MMNRHTVLLATLVLAACQPSATREPPLAGARIGGPFTLVDQDSKPRTDRDFAGKYRIMYFGYTFCPDVCPTDVANIAAGYRAFAKVDPARAARVVPVFVTIDPERDTPAVVKAFVSAFDPHLVGLTGSPAQIAAVAKAYVVVYKKEQVQGASGYLMDHSRAAYLMDPEGKPVALLSQDGKPDAIAQELGLWVK